MIDADFTVETVRMQTAYRPRLRINRTDRLWRATIECPALRTIAIAPTAWLALARAIDLVTR